MVGRLFGSGGFQQGTLETQRNAAGWRWEEGVSDGARAVAEGGELGCVGGIGVLLSCSWAPAPCVCPRVCVRVRACLCVRASEAWGAESSAEPF